MPRQLEHPGLQPVDHAKSVYLRAQESIKDYIVQNRLLPGSPLPPEGTLAKLLGISRNSVRESVKALATVGVVESRHGSGLFVGDFNFDVILDNLPYGLQGASGELTDLLEVRRVLELGMVEKVVALVDEEQLAELRVVLTAMLNKASRGESFPEEDRAFHRTLYEHVGNRVLTKVIDVFWLTHHRTAMNIDIDDPDPMSTYAWHEAIYEALVEREPQKLWQTIDRHYDGIYHRLGTT